MSKRQRMEAATIGDFLVLVWVWAVGSDPVGDMRTVFKPSCIASLFAWRIERAQITSVLESRWAE